MKTVQMRLSIWLLVGLSAACGRGMTPSSEPEPTLQGDIAELRIRSENTGDFHFLELAVREVRVLTDNGPLPTRLAKQAPDYLIADHSPLVAQLGIPEGISTFQVEVTFDDFGSFETGQAEGFIDARGAPLTFTADRAALFEAGHVVVHLDIQRSLPVMGADAERRVLLPNLNVRY
jgi:hypothetical protein